MMFRISAFFLCFVLASACVLSELSAQDDTPPQKPATPKPADKKLDPKELPPKRPQPPKELKDAEALPAPPEDAMAGFYTSTLKELLNQELGQLKKTVDLTDKQSEGLKKEMDSVIEKIVKEQIKGKSGENLQVQYAMQTGLPRKLSDSLIGAVVKLVGEAKIRDYKANVAAKHAFRVRVATGSILATVDQNLSLTAEQFQVMKKVLKDHWQPHWESTAAMMLFGGGLGAIKEIPDSVMKSALTELQFKAWLSAKKQFAMGIALSAYSGDEGETRMAKELKEFKTKVTEAVDLRIDEFHRAYKLSASQKKKFQIVGKGVNEQLVQKRKDAMLALRKASEDQKAGQPFQLPDVDIMMTLSCSPAILLSSSSRWPLFARKVLDDGQLKLYEKREAERSELQRRAIPGIFVLAMDRELHMSAKQYLEFEELLLSAAKPKATLSPFAFYEDLFSLSDEKFQEILSEEQWGKLKPQLDSMRQQLKSQKKKSS